MDLRTANVTRYILPLREGGSLPALAEADDEFKYVVKFRGAGHGTKALIAELIGGEIARALGFRVPEIVFLHLDEAFGRTEADEEIQISAKSTNKFRYQANRAFIIGRIKSIVPKILCGLFELSIIEQLYTDAVRCRSQLLPGRSFPRKKLKSKGRSHFRNKKASF